MKDVNSPNDKVQWATDKTTNNSISYKRACNTDFSSYHTLCFSSKNERSYWIEWPSGKDNHCYFKCHMVIGQQHRIYLIIIIKKHLWKSTGMKLGINKISHSICRVKSSNEEINNNNKKKVSERGLQIQSHKDWVTWMERSILIERVLAYKPSSLSNRRAKITAAAVTPPNMVPPNLLTYFTFTATNTVSHFTLKLLQRVTFSPDTVNSSFF